MNKLLAFVSSVAVCGSAVAVSVLSYFSHPSETNADGTPSSLVTTSIENAGSFPVITFPKSDLVGSTSDLYAVVDFCPTGWSSPSSYVSPSSYGTYSPNFYLSIRFRWAVAQQYFQISAWSHFDAELSGQTIFTLLNLYNPDDGGGLPSLHLLLSAVSPFSSASTFTAFDSPGTPITPSSLLSNNVVFQLSGLLGNDYEYWRYYTSYQAGHTDGYTDGYSEGHSAGTSEGFSTGYLDGHGVGYDAGYNVGYSAGDSAGYSRGSSEVSSQFGMWDLFSNAFGSIGNILGIQLFPGVSVGLLLSVPIAFAFILWLIHVLKG